MPGISIRRLDFAYGGNRIFDKFDLDLGKENPVVILGPSGCGKTTLLFLIAGLLKPSGGKILIDGGGAAGGGDGGAAGGGGVTGGGVPTRAAPGPSAAMVFQEPRLLPWLNVLENVALPIERPLGKKPARERARYFLELAGLGDRVQSLPAELSGGQRQRVNLARAFAFPSPVILLDEPFQSQDIPLKLQLMDLVMTLLSVDTAVNTGREEGRLVVAVTHEPREAACLGRRIIVLGRPGPVKLPGPISPGITGGGKEGPRTVPVFDEILSLGPEDRSYLSPAQLDVERRLLGALQV